jgi:hypothetical protein
MPVVIPPATADGASVDCAAGAARPGYDFFFIRWHSPRQCAQLPDASIKLNDGSQFI